MKKKVLNIALVGNPNSGKTSLFNALTGMNQKVGNFPGVTVDKKTGISHINEQIAAHIIDLPGSYSLYPKREDEWVSYRVLLQEDDDVQPDLVILVADASNLKRNLLFCSQLLDLKIPMLVALTMTDLARQKGLQVDAKGLALELGVPVVDVNPRKNKGITQLKRAIEDFVEDENWQPRSFMPLNELTAAPVAEMQSLLPGLSEYKSIHYLINHENFNLPPDVQDKIEHIEEKHQFNHTRVQAEEILGRFQRIKGIMQKTVVEKDPLARKMFTDRLDNLLLHRVWGYLILLVVLFLLFQSIFWLAALPMEGIEWFFAEASTWMRSFLPDTWWSGLLIDGIFAGIGGIVIFVPQIAILFGLISLLEDTGYMARISFLTDKLMRKTGLNGKSIMPMISGFACAIPAIMSARNIENKKERLLTILVTPLMSCSARLPVYTILIGLIIPSKYYFGFLSLQGLVMMGLYLFGLFVALGVAWIAKWFIHIKEKSYFILELPVYRPPRWKNVLQTMVEKARIFVVDAGKIIMVISIILWFLSSYGPPGRIEALEQRYETLRTNPSTNEEELEAQYQSDHLANSYAGIIGHAIEPVIKPLGYDWKIGIALVTSFAAREVFVGTMATLYSVGETDDETQTLTEKMEQATWPDGRKVYTFATGISLLLFYLLAMQCMSTLAITQRETRGWKWPMIQLAVMSVLAYGFAFIAYQLLS